MKHNITKHPLTGGNEVQMELAIEDVSQNNLYWNPDQDPMEEEEQPTLPPFIAFMVRIPHHRLEDLTTLIVRHGGPATQWLLAKEKDKEDREHFHGIAFMTDEEYDKVQRHFREVWKLCGKATQDQTREYGRVRKIKDKNKMLSYTIKDGNVVTSENWDIDLEQYIAASYQKPKETLKELREKELKKELINTNYSNTIPTKNIAQMNIIQFRLYHQLCSKICRIYNKYHFDFPTIKTINRLLLRYGWMEIEDSIRDHLSCWFSVRNQGEPHLNNYITWDQEL